MSLIKQTFNFIHCDVFASEPYSGNSLAVFPESEGLSGDQMLTITQELRHFESIFLKQTNGRICPQVFDLFKELLFAGHPIIGAACILHKQSGTDSERIWTLELQAGRSVQVTTEYRDGRYFGTLDQGRPKMLGTVEERAEIAQAFNLGALADLPLEVISTGLKYLVVPVDGGLADAHITVPDLETKLNSFGAEFAYLFDVGTFEGRHWNNDGIMEDVATGSAAGVVGAYALKHGLAQPSESVLLKQGHFMGRPSALIVTPFGTSGNVERVTVAGEVAFVGQGEVIAP
ncbi:PhzF family phenazine biosynthesis protein [Cohaesibacter sp. CAU 1516]|uniref:PhzF family phenazine biosynthesis protein n=1 Tax=Cohaesibacter sp. CAU 1516 TaxID=2576038 RepID=UPI0010FDA9A8|nr:PhzF family phenazine biosynthesis protein [Cohaesibacter sp. CAU 1516]TLP43852.1 PhzF family phenazine biosynthesis protein [Cohaesibacter sp. CAU 1516]